MKPLLPTLKERQRYIAYEVISAHPVQDISEPLLQKLSEILGVFGMADAGILSISYDTATQTGILRVNHTSVAKVRAALIMITHLGRTQVVIRTRGASGMLNKVKRFMPEGARRTTKATTKGLRKAKDAK